MPLAHEPNAAEPDSMTIDPANLGSVDPLSVEGIFLVALSKIGTERDAFLNAQCVDQDQRQRVHALLVAYEQAGNFLQKPAVSAAPTPIGQYLAPCELPGTLGRLGSYEILEEIGRGGMGVVFRAHDPKLQRIVAVKALAPELARLPSARQRFLREARAAAAISHPHVVTIFAVEGTEEASLGTERTTLPFLVMECIVGQTLHDKIKRVGALKVEEIVRISRQIAEGLTAAHKRGLIHRDIKPANILLENGVERVKITDFGLARTTSDGGITHTGEILGTPQCMSPEQARGEIVDQRSDLFSLGCVMYTMYTGVSPFRADNMLAVMKKVCEVNPRPVAQMNPNIPEWLCELVHRLLEKEPERRVQTAGDVVSVLESQSSSGEVRAREAAAWRPADAPQPASTRPRLTQLALWQQWLPVVILVSAVIGFALGRNRYTYMMWLPVWTVLTWGALSWAKSGLKRNWTWINWKSFIASVITLFAGANLRVWMMAGSPRSNIEIFLQNYAGLFVFPLAIGIFWLLTRLTPWLFIFTQRPAASGIPLAPTQPRSPWSVLAWMFVAVLGLGMFSGLGLLTALIMPHLPNPNDLRPAQPHSGPHPVYLTIRSSLGEKITGVTVDGTPAFVTSLGAGMCQLQVQPGPHAIVVAFESSDPKNYERSYSTKVDGRMMEAIEIEAVPVYRPVIQGSVQAIPPTLGASGDGTDNPSGDMTRPAGTSGNATSANASNAPEDNITANNSIPLGDAVEVLTDPTQMPAPATGMLPGGFGTASEFEMTQAVWIDEPGLLIRMKRMGFEGSEGADLEYYSNVAWGTGPFMATNERGEYPHDFPAGRYQVLVQDLDYGWPLDRRGKITIGNGPLCVHVKRSFLAHQLPSSGTDKFPLSFRWAGKTYQITTPDEVQVVNALLAATTDHTTEKPSYVTPETFRSHSLFLEAVHVDPQGGGHSLKRERTLAQFDIQSADMTAGFMSPLGRIAWKGARRSSEGVFVPRFELRRFVKDELIGWNSPNWYDNQSIDKDDPLTTPQIARRDRALIKKFAETEPAESPAVNVFFYWFGAEDDLPLKSSPAIVGLITAWADGQPDVPEAELLQLGGATSMDELWKRPAPFTPPPVSYIDLSAGKTVEPKTEKRKPEFVPPASLVPGSTPGTWRIKEPPEGALTPN